MSFALTYQDYLNSLPSNSESSSTPTPGMSEIEWNALPIEQRFKLIGNGGLVIGRNDPRYAELFAQTGGEEGRPLSISPGKFDPANQSRNGEGQIVQALKDPTHMFQGDGFWAHNPSEETPDAQKQGGMSDRQWALMAAALGLGAYGATAFAGAGGGAGAAGELVGPPASAALDFSPMAALPETTVGSLGPAFEAGGAGGLGGLGAAASGGGGADLSTMASLPSTSVGELGPAFSPSSPSLLSQAGQFASKNPMTVARGALGLAALGAGGKDSGSGGGPGNSSDPTSIIEQMARANRVNQTTPIGSRTWSQDANGQWSVNDAMSAPEQANFTNVQGMNANVTDMAKQRLAEILAAPKFKIHGLGG
jgi:hypothetical protein